MYRQIIEKGKMTHNINFNAPNLIFNYISVLMGVQIMIYIKTVLTVIKFILIYMYEVQI